MNNIDAQGGSGDNWDFDLLRSQRQLSKLQRSHSSVFMFREQVDARKHEYCWECEDIEKYKKCIFTSQAFGGDDEPVQTNSIPPE